MSSEPRCYSLELKNTKEKLKLTALSIDVVITAFLAKTAVTMTFMNETDHDGVEGELVFPMADGSVLAGYAIDINGDLVEGVVIEKEKARQVFETEARKEVSHKPTASIAEHVVGNVFKTRVFPIPKRAPRTIRVTTVEELGANGAFYLLLDFAGKSIENYSFNVQVDCHDGTVPRLWDGLSSSPRSGRTMAALEFSKPEKKNKLKSSSASVNTSGSSLASSDSSAAGDEDSGSQRRVRYQERITSSEPISPQGCIVYLAPTKKLVIVESNQTGSEHYFVIGGLFNAGGPSSRPVSSSTFDVQSNRIGILWDTSLSRSMHDKKVDLEIVQKLAAKLGAKAKFDFIPFADSMGTPVTLTMTGNSSSDNAMIKRHIDSLIYDGGTNIAGLKLSKGPTFEHTTDTYAYYCLFTDGMHNMSTKALPEQVEAPVYIFASASEANTSLLKILARKSGGEYYKLAISSSSSELADIVNQLGTPAFSFLGVNVDSNVVQEVYPSIPTRVDSVFRLAGKIVLDGESGNTAANGTLVTLNFGFGARVTQSVTYHLALEGASFTSLIPRFWAQRKIDELTLFPEDTENEQKILDLGRQFSIVTPSTSIIVLEELEQYLKHDIEPPAALDTIRAKWLAIMQERANEKKAAAEEKIVSVLSVWNRRVAWWNEDMASAEAREKNHMHYLPFGEGVDLISRALATQWNDWDRAHLVEDELDYSSTDSSSDMEEGSSDEEMEGEDEDDDSDSSGTGSGSVSSDASSSNSMSEEEGKASPTISPRNNAPMRSLRMRVSKETMSRAKRRTNSAINYLAASADDLELSMDKRDISEDLFGSTELSLGGKDEDIPSDEDKKLKPLMLAKAQYSKERKEGRARHSRMAESSQRFGDVEKSKKEKAKKEEEEERRMDDMMRELEEKRFESEMLLMKAEAEVQAKEAAEALAMAMTTEQNKAMQQIRSERAKMTEEMDAPKKAKKKLVKMDIHESSNRKLLSKVKSDKSAPEKVEEKDKERESARESQKDGKPGMASRLSNFFKKAEAPAAAPASPALPKPSSARVPPPPQLQRQQQAAPPQPMPSAPAPSAFGRASSIAPSLQPTNAPVPTTTATTTPTSSSLKFLKAGKAAPMAKPAPAPVPAPASKRRSSPPPPPMEESLAPVAYLEEEEAQIDDILSSITELHSIANEVSHELSNQYNFVDKISLHMDAAPAYPSAPPSFEPPFGAPSAARSMSPPMDMFFGGAPAIAPAPSQQAFGFAAASQPSPMAFGSLMPSAPPSMLQYQAPSMSMPPPMAPSGYAFNGLVSPYAAAMPPPPPPSHSMPPPPPGGPAPAGFGGPPAPPPKSFSLFGSPALDRPTAAPKPNVFSRPSSAPSAKMPPPSSREGRVGSGATGRGGLLASIAAGATLSYSRGPSGSSAPTASSSSASASSVSLASALSRRMSLQSDDDEDESADGDWEGDGDTGGIALGGLARKDVAAPISTFDRRTSSKQRRQPSLASADSKIADANLDLLSTLENTASVSKIALFNLPPLGGDQPIMLHGVAPAPPKPRRPTASAASIHDLASAIEALSLKKDELADTADRNMPTTGAHSPQDLKQTIVSTLSQLAQELSGLVSAATPLVPDITRINAHGKPIFTHLSSLMSSCSDNAFSAETKQQLRAAAMQIFNRFESLFHDIRAILADSKNPRNAELVAGHSRVLKFAMRSLELLAQEVGRTDSAFVSLLEALSMTLRADLNSLVESATSGLKLVKDANKAADMQGSMIAIEKLKPHEAAQYLAPVLLDGESRSMVSEPLQSLVSLLEKASEQAKKVPFVIGTKSQVANLLSKTLHSASLMRDAVELADAYYTPSSLNTSTDSGLCLKLRVVVKWVLSGVLMGIANIEPALSHVKDTLIVSQFSQHVKHIAKDSTVLLHDLKTIYTGSGSKDALESHATLAVNAKWAMPRAKSLSSTAVRLGTLLVADSQNALGKLVQTLGKGLAEYVQHVNDFITSYDDRVRQRANSYGADSTPFGGNSFSQQGVSDELSLDSSSASNLTYSTDSPIPASQIANSEYDRKLRESAEQLDREIALAEQAEMQRRAKKAIVRFAAPFTPSSSPQWDSLGTNTLSPYTSPKVSLEFAYYKKIDEDEKVEYSVDLTPPPEFPPVDWDKVHYASTPAAQSWKKWRQRHREQSWHEYELEAFGGGETFMDIFNRNRRLILQSRIQADFEAVEAENRRNRVIKSHEKVHERFRWKMGRETVPAEEPWQMELELQTSTLSAYKQYVTMRERPELAKLTKFYMDTADYFFDKLNDHFRAATILSNLAELELENPQFLRLIAFRLERAPVDPFLPAAIHLYRKVLAIRSEEPQSHRDLALALARRALHLARNLEEKRKNPETGAAFTGAIAGMSAKKAMMLMSRPAYDRYALQEERKVQSEIRALLVESVKLLNNVLLKKWDVRFSQVEIVALMDLNRVVAIIRSLNLEHVLGLSNLVDPRVIAVHMPVDLRIQVQWDTDMTDVELSVIEPSGEKCSSICNKTSSGGMMSRDFTHGYGPVEYLTRFADNGHYTATVKLFHALEMKSGTTVLIRVWTDYGRPELEKEHFFVGRLNKAKQMLTVADIAVDNGMVITKA